MCRERNRWKASRLSIKPEASLKLWIKNLEPVFKNRFEPPSPDLEP